MILLTHERRKQMDLNQALNVAKQLKNHFRAFEYLDDFVKKTVALEGTLKEFESRRDALQKEVSTLEEKKGKLAGMENEYGKLEREVDLLEERKAQMATVESDCARLEGERNELQKTVDELKKEVDEIRKKMSQSLKKM